jgi:hypothetical protein
VRLILNDSDFELVERSSQEEPVQILVSVRIARWLFALLGVIWLVIGIWSLARINSSVGGMILVIIAVLMFIDGAVLLWIGWGIGRGRRLYYYFGLLVLAGNIFLTLTDEFGALDMIVLIIAACLLVLLILTR